MDGKPISRRHFIESSVAGMAELRDLPARELFQSILLYRGFPSIKGQTLLFLDEVQKSPAEVDFVVQHKKSTVSVEVKAGSKGTLKAPNLGSSASSTEALRARGKRAGHLPLVS